VSSTSRSGSVWRGSPRSVQVEALRAELISPSVLELHDFITNVPIYIDDMLPSRSLENGERTRVRMKEMLFSFLNDKRDAIKLAYRFYLSHSMYKTERSEWTLGLNQLRAMLKDCKVSAECISQIGVIVRQAKQVRNEQGAIIQESHMTGDVQMSLQEFVEVLVRLGWTQFRSKKEWNVLERAQRFFSAHFLPNAQQFTLDSFRSNVLQHPEVAPVLSRNGKLLEAVFLRCASRPTSMHADSIAIGLSDYFEFAKKIGILDQKLTIARLNYIYIISNFESDVTDWSDWDFDMDFREFCEAVARIAISRYSLEDFDQVFTQARPQQTAEAIQLLLEEKFLTLVADDPGRSWHVAYAPTATQELTLSRTFVRA
jgi:hypothetical protein